MENVKYTVIELNRETKIKEGLIEKSEKQRKLFRFPNDI
jgi:hypothetical protein